MVRLGRQFLVESRIWHMFGSRLLAPEADGVLSEIRTAIGLK